MPYFEGAANISINKSSFNDIAGDATFNNHLYVNLFTQHMTGSPLPPDVQKKLEKHVLSQAIGKLPCASAAYNDYTTQDKRRTVCFEGTREALLKEIANWMLSMIGPRLYLLWGIAGAGKSTVAQTVAERADNLCRLGASFFFSRNEVGRKNARMFFTTIAFHLCSFSDFADAIEKVLLTQRGLAAISKEPLEQLKTLILEPLRDFNLRNIIPMVIVIDALDECDDEDAPIIFMGLTRLVQELPFFKVILTTRPQPHLRHRIQNPNTQAEFHLQNIEDKIIDNDIRLYLKHRLSTEQVREHLPGLRSQWSANHQEIASLVRAAGQLFIIASTSVLFILDKVARNPASRMEMLQDHFARDRTPLNALNEFYTVVLRSVVPEGCERGIVDQYQLVTGTIILIQDPLPVEALAVLIGLPEASVYAVLDNLQSVVSIGGKNIPQFYHKSFPDYVTDDTRCKDYNLCIVPRAHHNRMAVRCLRLMNEHLKQNILGIGTHHGFVDNDNRLLAEKITMEQLMKKISADLRYACIYWADHVKGAEAENVDLAKEVEIFLMRHLLHWLEALSWINKIDIAYPAVCVLSKYMKPTSSHARGIISDALRFVARFSEEIRLSALYTYYCALPFTPTNCALYKVHSKGALCRLESMPTQWDALRTACLELQTMFDPIFSHDSSKLSSMGGFTKMTLLDTESGRNLQSYEGDSVAVAHDFSVVAVSDGCSVKLLSTDNHVPITKVTSPKEVDRLALSFDGARLAVGFVDGTVCLWDARNIRLVASLEGYAPREPKAFDRRQLLKFAPSGYRLALITDDDGMIWLWDGENGRMVARLDYTSEQHSKFVFSRDGSRLASLTWDCSLTLWDGEKGIFIGAVRHAGTELAISGDGSFIAAGGSWLPVKLWSGNPLSLVGTLDTYARDLSISCNTLAVASYSDDVMLYDINSRTVMATLCSDPTPGCLALSPDCTRLVVGYEDDSSKLFDVALLKTSIPTSKRQVKSQVSALAFSPDSFRLASGLDDGTIELWDTNHGKQPIATQKLHSKSITMLAFSLDGQQFASGSWDKTIRFWDGKDGMPMSQFQHSFTTALALSLDLLAAATRRTIALFDKSSHFCVCTLGSPGGHSLTFSGDGTLLASASDDKVTVWNVAERAAIATFKAKSIVERLMFSPDVSQLSARMYEYEGYELFDIDNKESINLVGFEHPSWIPGVIGGLFISWVGSSGRQRLVGRSSRNHDWIGVLWIPKDSLIRRVEFGSSIVALGCLDGHVLFIRFPTTSNH